MFVYYIKTNKKLQQLYKYGLILNKSTMNLHCDILFTLRYYGLQSNEYLTHLIGTLKWNSSDANGHLRFSHHALVQECSNHPIL